MSINGEGYSLVLILLLLSSLFDDDDSIHAWPMQMLLFLLSLLQFYALLSLSLVVDSSVQYMLLDTVHKGCNILHPSSPLIRWNPQVSSLS